MKSDLDISSVIV